MQEVPVEVPGLAIVPIGKRQGTEINIIVLSIRAVEDDWTDDTLAILDAVVAVVPVSGLVPCFLALHQPQRLPAGTMLGGAVFISLGGTRSNGALGHTIGAILRGRAELADTVPVNAGTVIRDIVVHNDPHFVSPFYEIVSGGLVGKYGCTYWL